MCSATGRRQGASSEDVVHIDWAERNTSNTKSWSVGDMAGGLRLPQELGNRSSTGTSEIVAAN